MPLEIQYFNQKLNFFEPLLERTTINISFSSSKEKGKNISITTEKVLNLNLSIAFYQSIIQTAQIFKEESENANMLNSAKSNMIKS